ncbi:hypothetical protein FSB64_41790 [Paraburkholderia sp. JPY454]|uniref:Terminase large subunit gp17-like C-terminal domain-containing protein n=1 Tax=Paraburkholderia youngii TaxID=2782701 RepID=A0ABX2NZE6_9BURK|nr:hypothetical protein [Paraburkholderia youngii]
MLFLKQVVDQVRSSGASRPMKFCRVVNGFAHGSKRYRDERHEHDTSAIDDAVLALLYLTLHDHSRHCHPLLEGM